MSKYKHPPLDFLMDNPNTKLCSVCGEAKKLSFEHMPPEKSRNDKPINMVGLENATTYGGYLFNKFTKSPRGFGGYKLCERCNKLTGSWYVNSYIDLSDQLNKAIDQNLGINDLDLKCTVKPLNFLKQVLCLMLCSDQANGKLRNILNAKELILNREANQIPEEVYISMFPTIQPVPGFKGFMPSWTNINGFKNNIEFVFRPFAFKLTLNEREKGVPEANLANWKSYDYDEEIEIIFPLKLKHFKSEQYT